MSALREGGVDFALMLDPSIGEMYKQAKAGE